MNAYLARRVTSIKPSATMAVTARAAALRAAGRDVIGLGAGEPDFDTPEHIKAAARAALDQGYTKYTPVDGLPALKSAVAAKLARDNGLEYTASQIVISCGAKHALFNVLQALLNEGDEVIVPAPFWVSYPDMVTLSGGTPLIVDAPMESGFKLSAERLARAVTSRTRMLILNSPGNPTGACYSREELAALGGVLEQHPRVFVVTDDIYEHIAWGKTPFCNIPMACPSLRDRTVVVNGVSKAYAMTGWRIGYAAGPDAVIGAMRTVQSQSTSNPCSISQIAAQAALEGDQRCVAAMVQEFRQRHDYVVDRLNRMDGIRCLPADGAFYAFPDMRGAIDATANVSDDVAMAEHLLEHAGVALVPGSAFGAPGFMRLSYATSMGNLRMALERIERALGSE